MKIFRKIDIFSLHNWWLVVQMHLTVYIYCHKKTYHIKHLLDLQWVKLYSPNIVFVLEPEYMCHVMCSFLRISEVIYETLIKVFFFGLYSVFVKGSLRKQISNVIIFYVRECGFIQIILNEDHKSC